MGLEHKSGRSGSTSRFPETVFRCRKGLHGILVALPASTNDDENTR
jgi:hypothetical protein